MPTADTMLDEALLARILVYGAPKTKKTWWAIKAAEAGFNVLLLDCDDGYHIVKNVAPEARKRIYIMDITDTPKTNVASIFSTLFLKQVPFHWLEVEKKTATMNADKMRASSIETLRQLDSNCVVILDSWTALVNSLIFQFAKENQIDLADASKQEWEGYRWTGQMANWMLGQIKTFKCHFVVIAHQDVYEKRKQEGKTQTVEWSRTQVKSTSGKHAMQLTQYFSDVLYFTSINDKNFRINTGTDKERDGGSRLIPPAQYDWEKLTFKEYCILAGIKLPPPDAPMLDFTSVVSEVAAPAIPAVGVVTKPAVTTANPLNVGTKPLIANISLQKK